MSHNTHERIRNFSHVSSISLAILFFYFIIKSFFFAIFQKKIRIIIYLVLYVK